MSRSSVRFDLDIEDEPKYPGPNNFNAFVPWACSQFGLLTKIEVIGVIKEDTARFLKGGTRNRVKSVSAPQSAICYSPNTVNQETNTQKKDDSDEILYQDDYCKFRAIYQNENLVQLKFGRNPVKIPRILLKVINIALRYHPGVYNITINSCADMFTCYELAKMLQNHNLTELCLDGTYIKQANYDILLENPGQMRYLSLSRCSLNDLAIELIVSRLKYPLPASQCLSALNLSSNKITDEGARHIATALRSNRQICYLNLSGNELTDDGANAIFAILTPFFLTSEEFIAKNRCFFHYLKHKKSRNKLLLEDVDSVDDFSSPRKKVITQPDNKKKGLPESSVTRTKTNVEDDALGNFIHPFDVQSTKVKNGLLYSNGNNRLCYLNVAYNNLGYGMLKKLTGVLEYQRLQNRATVLNICIEGNLMPAMCAEIEKIRKLMDPCQSLNELKRSALSVKKPKKAY